MMEESARDRAIVCVGTMKRSRDLFPPVCGLFFYLFLVWLMFCSCSYFASSSIPSRRSNLWTNG